MVEITMIPWLHAKGKKEAARDKLKAADMIGDAFAIVAIIAMALYFVSSQLSNTGFFTDGFGSLEAFFFYGVAVSGVFPPALRLILRRRNVARPAEIGNSIFAIVAIIYLLSTFPFDFAHLASPLPSVIQNALSWLTNDVARLLMVFGVVLTAFVTAWMVVTYLAVRKVLEERTDAGPSENRV